jgi:predicted small secreted protein
MATKARNGEVRVMKTQTRFLLVLLLAIEALIAAGCAHTAKGVSQDYHAAEDKVEQAVK